MLMTVICPNGVRSGMPINISHPQTKQHFQVVVPAGVEPGMQFQVQIPDAVPAPQPQMQQVVGVLVGGPPGYGAPPGYAPSAPIRADSSYGQQYAPPQQQVPDIRSNKAVWFDHYDRDRSGGIDRRELVSALIETFDVREPHRQADIGSAVEACWGMFDFDYNGVVSRQEFLRTEGLADVIIANIRYP
ncbi:hypothetical protein T492DRAFT_930758 [Pavlovales sp. CCMP2436]|nr:hypothetical protein T492DRAFT_930758 [Pavlovales sp. CCMP2436]